MSIESVNKNNSIEKKTLIHVLKKTSHLQYPSVNDSLKTIIVESLQSQGFLIEDDKIVLPKNYTKEDIRNLHQVAVEHRRQRSKKGLFRFETDLLSKIASGDEVNPHEVYPRMIEVKSGSKEELLFRYASLHWSIPVSSGYGRRIRFLIFDEQNGKLIGLFGLGDPVFGLASRDKWIGWDRQKRKSNLKYVLDAFVLGAVPPYSSLLCGKLIAMLITSNEVREAFRKKYEKSQSLINGEQSGGRLGLLTTTSALGSSSVYDRIKFHNRLLFHRVGFTSGSGEFQFSNGIYKQILEYSKIHCGPTAKQVLWGTGFRNRREVIQKCLKSIGLSNDWLYHNIKREIFVIPLAKNTREFLIGNDFDIEYFDQSIDDLFDFFKERWLIPRSQRDMSYKTWKSSQWILWNHNKQEELNV